MEKKAIIKQMMMMRKKKKKKKALYGNCEGISDKLLVMFRERKKNMIIMKFGANRVGKIDDSCRGEKTDIDGIINYRR